MDQKEQKQIVSFSNKKKKSNLPFSGISESENLGLSNDQMQNKLKLIKNTKDMKDMKDKVSHSDSFENESISSIAQLTDDKNYKQLEDSGSVSEFG